MMGAEGRIILETEILPVRIATTHQILPRRVRIAGDGVPFYRGFCGVSLRRAAPADQR